LRLLLVVRNKLLDVGVWDQADLGRDLLGGGEARETKRLGIEPSCLPATAEVCGCWPIFGRLPEVTCPRCGGAQGAAALESIVYRFVRPVALRPRVPFVADAATAR